MDLRGAVTVVTGASRGIGRATAVLLAARGATVVCVGRDAARLDEVAGGTGGSALVVDVRDPDCGRHIVSQALAVHGGLDAVVANAGVGYAGALAEMPPDRVATLVDVNVRGPMLLAQAAVAAMRQQAEAGERRRRALVFVTSIAGAVGVPGESVYSATKASIEAFAQLLREEVRADGITVSTVLPGVVDTGFFATRGMAYDRRFPRPMPPERVADAVVSVLETGAARRFEPRWLAGPARLSTTAPGLYRALARRFG